MHGHYPRLEGGDLLIIAGDLTAKDRPIEYGHFAAWMDRLNYKKKIFIAGNHDNYFESKGTEFIKDVYQMIGVEYLCDSGTEFEGLKIWGSPWTKTFERMNPRCKAFTCDTEEELEEKWKKIPYGVDILITHSPPFKVLDQVCYVNAGENIAEHVGSHSLLYYSRMHQPKLHVFGHIHEAHGQLDDIIYYVNASHVNEKYKPVNKPIRVIL